MQIILKGLNMGSGKKFRFTQDFSSFAIGFAIQRWPHTVSLLISVFFWDVYIGFGKGYDE